MRKTIFILSSVLVAGVSFAQEKSESVSNILKELGDYQGVEAAPVTPVTEPVAAMPAAVVEAPVEVAPCDGSPC